MPGGRPVRGGARTAGLVWGVAVAAYAVAVLHRSSFGVAGVIAAERFEAGATVLATFVVVQLGVYAAMQVPVGVLLDRFGSRALIASGALAMAVGQTLLAVTTELPTAYLARVLIGGGDAATFIAVVRLVVIWFPARRVPLFTQLTGNIGLLGQLVAAVPLVAVLRELGWTAAFLSLGAVGAAAALAAWLAVRDAPAGTAASRTRLAEPLRLAARTPGTWLGFWSHTLGQFPIIVFVFLWGFPFLTEAQRLPTAQASGLLALTGISGIVAGPFVGVLTARHPLRRSWMVLANAVVSAGVWAAVLLQPGRSPVWLLAALALVIGFGGPMAVIGFDFARTFNPAGRVGTAVGLVNVGGFTTGVLAVLTVGVVLDLVGGNAGPLSLPAFRVAFAALALPWAIAVAGVLVTRRRTRRQMLVDGIVVPPIREVLARRRR